MSLALAYTSDVHMLLFLSVAIFAKRVFAKVPIDHFAAYRDL